MDQLIINHQVINSLGDVEVNYGNSMGTQTEANMLEQCENMEGGYIQNLKECQDAIISLRKNTMTARIIFRIKKTSENRKVMNEWSSNNGQNIIIIGGGGQRFIHGYLYKVGEGGDDTIEIEFVCEA